MNLTVLLPSANPVEMPLLQRHNCFQDNVFLRRARNNCSKNNYRPRKRLRRPFEEDQEQVSTYLTSLPPPIGIWKTKVKSAYDQVTTVMIRNNCDHRVVSSASTFSNNCTYRFGGSFEFVEMITSNVNIRSSSLHVVSFLLEILCSEFINHGMSMRIVFQLSLDTRFLA